MSENKTEKATPRRRQRAREKGQVAKSREVSSVVTLMAGITVLYFYGAHMYQRFKGFSQYLFANPSSESLHLLPHQVLKEFAFILTPLMAGVFVVAIAANISQVGFLFSVDIISPDLSKIDPIKGIKRLFSHQAIMEIFKSLAKIVIVGAVVFRVLKGEINDLITLMDRDVETIFRYLMSALFKITIYVAPIMTVLAALDYVFQRWEFEKNLRMTREEVKEEFRQTEGDPLVKTRIRSLQRQMAKQRMMKDVPKADVVIKNPTHLAVALRYVQGEMNAPKVVAKGAGIIAERIERIARSHGIPVIQNKKLAQALFKMVEIGGEIPAVLYQAVAEVLAYVYRLRGEMNG